MKIFGGNFLVTRKALISHRIFFMSARRVRWKFLTCPQGRVFGVEFFEVPQERVFGVEGEFVGGVVVSVHFEVDVSNHVDDVDE